MSRSLLRKVFLVLVILAALFCIFCGWKAYSIDNKVIAYLLLPIGIFIEVIGLEIFSVIVTKKTLSTNVTKSLETYKKVRIWIYLEMAGMILVLLLLSPHLFITGK